MFRNYYIAVAVVMGILSVAPAQDMTFYFLVSDPCCSDSYVLPLTELWPDVSHAFDLIEFGPSAGQPIVVADITSWDPNTGINVNRDYCKQGAPAWSWYVSDFGAFVNTTPEILDGNATQVEDGNFIGGTIGFWAYTVVAFLGIDLEPPRCDLSVDGIVDANDLALFSAQWLKSGCGHRYWCGGADLDENAQVDLFDFAILARNWLWDRESLMP